MHDGIRCDWAHTATAGHRPHAQWVDFVRRPALCGPKRAANGRFVNRTGQPPKVWNVRMPSSDTERAGPVGWFWRLVAWFIPATIRKGPRNQLRGAQAIVAVSLLVASTPPLGLSVGLAYDNVTLALLSAISHSLFVFVPLSLRWFGSLRSTVHLACTLGILVATAWMIPGGGAEGASLSLFVVVPMLAVSVLGRRAGLFWVGVTAVILTGFGIHVVLGSPWPTFMSEEERTMGRLSMTLLSAVFVWMVASAGHSATVRALSALAHANDDLLRARQEAEAASLAKGRFLANMSHELRTPMNGILGFADLLHLDEEDPERRIALETIQRSGRTLVALINDVLDFSKFESGRVALENVNFTLSEVCSSALEMVAHRAHGAGIEVGFATSEDWDLRVLGDPVRLTQILVNLLGNAAKFTEEGSMRLSVARIAADTFRFDISDTGIGIRPAAQAGLFVPFTQAEASTTRRFGGTGLGLSIVRELAHAMGGDVSVHSELGRGSTFSVQVQLQVVGPVARRARPGLSGCTVGVIAAPALKADLQEILPRLGLELSDDAPDLLIIDDILSTDNAAQAGAAHVVRAGRIGWPTTAIRGQQGPRFRVPVRMEELADALERGMGLLAAPPVAPRATGQSRLRVLLVEDHPVNQKVAARMLSRLGHECQIASNGSEALELLRAGGFDVVLMDCQMPQMDGLEATETWRSEETGRPLPIFALTANASSAERAACAAAGMDGFVEKPVTMAALSEQLRQVRAPSLA